MVVTAFCCFEGLAYKLVGLGAEEHDIGDQEESICDAQQERHERSCPLAIKDGCKITNVVNVLSLKAISCLQQDIKAENV